ncbi:zinc finger, CCHC-type containing protein [Tanacetum coccineum]
MKSYIDNLERLGHPVSLNLGVSLILISLQKEFDNFVQNYNMHGIGKTVNKLHAMLKLHEQTLTKKDHALHVIRAGKPKIPPPPKKENPDKDSIYHQCGDTGHWERNCPYTHICNTTQGLRGSRKLKPGALRIVLSVEDKLYYLGRPIPLAPLPAQAGQQVTPKALAAYAAWVKRSKEIEFDSFVQNYNMHGMRKTVNELHAMLKLHEQTLTKKDHALHRNYPQYLAKLLKNKKLSQGASGSGIFTIELYTFPNKSWVYDTGCSTHVCNTTQGLRGSRKLKPGALSLYVGNDNAISISKNNLVYFSVVLRDGIFEIDLSISNTNDSSMYVVSNKRAKLNLDSALLWHYHLGHISKKRIEKLQHDELLN